MVILLALLSFCFAQLPSSLTRDWHSGGVSTDALMVYHDGKIILEHYQAPMTAQTKHTVWSVAKTFLGIIWLKVAQDRGIDLDTPIETFLPQNLRGKHPNVTLKHMLTMTASIKWAETYETSPFNSDVIDMLFTSRPNVAGSLLWSHHQEGKPGSIFNYSSGVTNTLSLALKSVLKDKYDTMVQDYIFSPLQINGVCEKDSEGTFILSSYCYLTTKDLLEIGVDLLDGAPRLGLNTKSIEHLTKTHDKSGKTPYAMQTWTNAGADGSFLLFPNLPADTYFASGHDGQYLMVIPSWKTVIARYAFDKTRINHNTTIPQLLKVLGVTQ